MPGTVTTRELFPKDSTPKSIQDEVDRRIKAGAVSSAKVNDGAHWVITTVWNVIGENDEEDEE